MKRKQLKKRLTINKEIVANLDEYQLKDVKGGEHYDLHSKPDATLCMAC